MFDFTRTLSMEFGDSVATRPSLITSIFRTMASLLFLMAIFMMVLAVIHNSPPAMMTGLILLAASIAMPAPVFGWRDLLNLMATVFSYGGKSITTNRLRAAGTEPLNAYWGLSTATSLATDTALGNPSGEARVAGTSSLVTTAANVPNDTYQVVATITANATRAITEFGLFDTVTASPHTTLSAAITTTSQTAITVTANAGFPGTGTYYFQCDQEVIGVNAGQGTNSWTVVRGQRGSTAATHSSGAQVVGGEVTAGGNMFMKGDFTSIGLNSGDSIQFTAQVQFT